jgi:hypothetical protein
MSTDDVVLAALELVLAAVAIAVASWLVVQVRRRPGDVRLMRRPVPSPRLMAAAYFCFAVGFGANGIRDLAGRSDTLNVLSLLGMGAAVVLILAGAFRRRPAH